MCTLCVGSYGTVTRTDGDGGCSLPGEGDYSVCRVDKEKTFMFCPCSGGQK